MVCGADGLIGAQLLRMLALLAELTGAGDLAGVLAQAASVRARQKAIRSLFMNLTSSRKAMPPSKRSQACGVDIGTSLNPCYATARVARVIGNGGGR